MRVFPTVPTVVALAALLGCGGGGTTPTPTTTTAPRVTTTEFILSRENCFFGWSRPLEPVSVGESYTVRFKPLSVDYVDGSDWANTAEFWLDRIDADQTDGIGLVFRFAPDSQWFVDFYTAAAGFRTTGRRELINVNGDFREIQLVRSDGVSEWLLDGVVVLQMPDTKPERTVYTRVVGTDTLFQYDAVALGTVQGVGLTGEEGACMGPGPLVCAPEVE